MERLPALSQNLASQSELDLKSESTELNLLSESDRLRTFANWSESGPCKDVLAAAGLYFVEKDNLVKCVHCNLKIVDLTSNVALAHECFWTKSRTESELRDEREHEATSSTNSELHDEPAHKATPSTVSEACNKPDNKGSFNWDIEKLNAAITAVEMGARAVWLQQVDGTQIRSTPMFPQYSTLEARLKSFETWSYQKSPRVLSEAGYFFTGEQDRTICFHCGGGLKDWKELDDPWTEHAFWFPNCLNVLTIKGEQFIRQARAEKRGVVTPKEVRNSAEALKELIDIINSKLENKGKIPPVEIQTNSMSSWNSIGNDNHDSLATCRICFMEERDVLFVPCRHVVSCSKCAACLKSCPVCRGTIEEKVRVFHS